MRHFAAGLAERGRRVRYVTLDDPKNTHGFDGEVRRAVAALRPRSLEVIHPGDWRVMAMARAWASPETGVGVPVTIHEDDHFLTPLAEFERWASGRKQLTMEYFYREQRRRLGVLMEPDGTSPAGGTWNYDHDNREAFREAPAVRRPYTPRADAITGEVLELVERTFPGNPGTVEGFAWPVTPDQARRALADFVAHRLPSFGTYEDAMWSGERVLYHSALSPALNLKLLRPMACVDAALGAYAAGAAPLNAVEGFVRQIIGWREYIRGVYWQQGEGYPARNGLDQHGALPAFFWTGDTDMACLRDCLGSTLERAYAHHIPRLMVIGNFALIAGVDPREVGDWFLAMYADAVDWASCPNTIGMSQHADHAVVGTKPYASSGKYIDRMSNYCGGCRYDLGSRRFRDPSSERLFDGARPPCPFNVFYWDFLIRMREVFRKNQRMAMILKNVDRMKDEERVAITISAQRYRERFGVG